MYNSAVGGRMFHANAVSKNMLPLEDANEKHIKLLQKKKRRNFKNSNKET